MTKSTSKLTILGSVSIHKHQYCLKALDLTDSTHLFVARYYGTSHSRTGLLSCKNKNIGFSTWHPRTEFRTPGSCNYRAVSQVLHLNVTKPRVSYTPEITESLRLFHARICRGTGACLSPPPPHPKIKF